jgi:hypothetical protein
MNRLLAACLPACPVQVVGDDTSALDAVLECDTERLRLLAEEHSLMEFMSEEGSHAEAAAAAAAVLRARQASTAAVAAAQQMGAGAAAAAAAAAAPVSDSVLLAQRLAEVGKRLLEIGGWAAWLPGWLAGCIAPAPSGVELLQ